MPRLLVIPPYPIPSKLTEKLFIDRSYRNWNIEGISPFDPDESFPAPYRSALGGLYAYAGGMRVTQERIKFAHSKGQKVGVFGYSYGGNVLGAYLSFVESLPENEREDSLPDKIFVVEGGKIFESTLQSTYGKRADPTTVAAVINNRDILPSQTPLTPDVAERTFAVVNNDDLSVLGQAETWKGTKTFEISGSHIGGVIKKLPQIRRYLRHHFESLVDA